MEWIWDAANSLGVVALAVWAWFGFSYLGEENDQRKANIRKAQVDAATARTNSVEAKAIARAARTEVGYLKPKEVIVPQLPDTPHNKGLVEKLRGAAHRAELKRAAETARSKAAHPAGLRRNARSNMYTPGGDGPVRTTQSGIDYIPVAAAIALTTDTSSSYSDSSSSSSSSYGSGSSSSYSSSDSGGSFSSGDSGSF